ncbi:HET-domain-containing protein [Apiospora hydei]|uniref:HET-domain-containing protein n=1 Tax=Apiospora hydei TaxID=1337664 RepID=A0ABR1WEW6_9PEZI
MANAVASITNIQQIAASHPEDLAIVSKDRSCLLVTLVLIIAHSGASYRLGWEELLGYTDGLDTGLRMERSDEHSWHIYHSLPLRQDEFRLLKLYPAPTRQAPILVDLFKIEYGSPEVPSYDAISYQWGDPNHRRSLTANGQDISVTCSLYTALTYMRYESRTRIPWIDGVCINQEDTAEREQQVLKMGAIFSGAQCVRIFLGEAEDGNDMAQAIDLLSNLGTLEDRPHFIERIKLDQGSSRGLINLLRRPYWQRMWMFQEIVLAKKAVVHCGPYNISWENMRELDKISGDPEVWFQAQVSCDWILELRRALFDLAHFFVSEAEAQDFRNVLEPTRRLQCTNPRDKLFALIGVCNNIPIRAEYSRSVRDIYTDFTRQHLLAGCDMSPLLTAGLWNPGNGPQLDLPSWVPDYRGAHGVDIRYLAASHLAHFNASLKIKRSIGFPSRFKSPNPNGRPGGTVGPPPYMLATRGVIIDTVRAVTTLKNVQNSPQGLLRLVESKGLSPRSPSGE